ncbi:Bug family tripartite tricarboxylate transporter substrate binding protein [Bordetella genomosp. 13]|uniref:Bug family tripartite tricarboxylate transporter substrate binding protein n=1 Tax=Bordetella genomosp. 13 TaxID=463040 RepID=UPI001642366B|nr:tripartite tricarboxylate transporter substrate binding protein [Bordetella genomosp. 13]
MKQAFRRVASRLLAVLGMMGAAGAACAQQYPDHPIEVIVPYAPGGLLDVAARLAADGLGKELGQAVVVKNYAGAGGTIGAARLAKARPDGYTLGLGSFGMVINKVLRPEVDYDPLKSFTTIGYLGDQAFVLMVNPQKTRAGTTAELIDLIRANPGKYTYASGGVGAPSHVMAEQLAIVQKLDVVHIPYQGQNPAILALLGGEVDFSLQTVAGSEDLIHTGRILALASTGKKRLTALPQVPTFSEQGIGGLEPESWLGIFAPAGLSDPVRQRLQDAWANVARSAAFQEQLARRAIESRDFTPAQFNAMIARDQVYWRDVVGRTGITLK